MPELDHNKIAEINKKTKEIEDEFGGLANIPLHHYYWDLIRELKKLLS